MKTVTGWKRVEAAEWLSKEEAAGKPFGLLCEKCGIALVPDEDEVDAPAALRAWEVFMEVHFEHGPTYLVVETAPGVYTPLGLLERVH